MTLTAANDNWPIAGSIRFRVEPRLVPASKAARRLHLTATEFEAKRADLYGIGFPPPCPVTGHYDLIAIDAWLDQRAGLAGAPTAIVSSDDFEARLALL